MNQITKTNPYDKAFDNLNPDRWTTPYSGAMRIVRYLKERWAMDIKYRDGDAPQVQSRTKLKQTGMDGYCGSENGSAIFWEGFYEWTNPKEIAVIEKLLHGTGLIVSVQEEWMLEVIQVWQNQRFIKKQKHY